jgi:hypothetical protein
MAIGFCPRIAILPISDAVSYRREQVQPLCHFSPLLSVAMAARLELRSPEELSIAPVTREVDESYASRRNCD